MEPRGLQQSPTSAFCLAKRRALFAACKVATDARVVMPASMEVCGWTRGDDWVATGHGGRGVTQPLTRNRDWVQLGQVLGLMVLEITITIGLNLSLQVLDCGLMLVPFPEREGLLQEISKVNVPRIRGIPNGGHIINIKTKATWAARRVRSCQRNKH